VEIRPRQSGSSVAALTEYCVGDVTMGDALERLAEFAVIESTLDAVR